MRYYPFMDNWDRCNRSCNTLDDPSGKICVPKTTEDVNVSVFNVIMRKNKSKTLTKYVSYECKYKLGSTKYNLNEKSNNDSVRLRTKWLWVRVCCGFRFRACFEQGVP